jgi:hypothetical protein
MSFPQTVTLISIPATFFGTALSKQSPSALSNAIALHGAPGRGAKLFKYTFK